MSEHLLSTRWLHINYYRKLALKHDYVWYITFTKWLQQVNCKVIIQRFLHELKWILSMQFKQFVHATYTSMRDKNKKRNSTGLLCSFPKSIALSSTARVGVAYIHKILFTKCYIYNSQIVHEGKIKKELSRVSKLYTKHLWKSTGSVRFATKPIQYSK